MTLFPDNARLRRSGFTLMESMVAVGIAAMLGAALMVAVTSALSSSAAVTDRAIGHGIAKQLIDEISLAKYCEDPGNPYQWPLGKEAGEGAQRIDFDDIDDYDNYSQSPPTDLWGLQLGIGDEAGATRHPQLQIHQEFLTNWRCEIDVFYVDDDNPTVALADGVTSNSKAVTVDVWIDGPSGATPAASLRRVFVNINQ